MSEDERKENPPATRLARVFPDHPLRAERLEFEFEGFARTLAELAWNPDNGTPFTAVVRGGWGRGKTTLLRRAQWMLDHPDELDEPPPAGVRRVRTLWFNAWKYSDDDTVLAGLLGAAIDALRTGGKLDQLKLLVDSYKSGTLRALFALAAPAPLRDVIAGGVDDKFRPVHEKRAFHDTFRDLFVDVSRLLFDVELAFRDTGGLTEEQQWTEERQRREVVAIFLDDLDRCRHERVVEVLEAINLFLDLPGVCFFLGIDWERLVAVLPETVRDQGSEFLEKVVQVAFDLPEVSPSGAQGYVSGLLEGTELAAVLGGDEEDGAWDLRVLARSLEIRHPRHVKRFLNDLSMTLAVLRNTGKLGEGEDLLPERAVVAWHLLSEVLPDDEWREVRALPQNLRKFLVDMERAGTKDDFDKQQEEASEATETWTRMRTTGLAKRHLAALHDLSDRQRHLLVYLATPPVVGVVQEARRTGKRDLFDLDSPAWVEIPGGTFHMGAQAKRPQAAEYDPEAHGDESPAHRVTVSRFHLAQHPVTNGEYAVYVTDTGQEPPAHWNEGRIPEGKEEHPVTHVRWQDGVAYCQWLSENLTEIHDVEVTVRLPTEAEWELAARGEEGRRYPWGGRGPTSKRANYGGNVGDTTPVGSYPDGQTPEGTQDMAGNVLEWCGDRFGNYPKDDETDSTGPRSGASRVLRGGAFNSPSWGLRAAFRYYLDPEARIGHVGFRLLRSWSRGLSP